MPQSLSKVYVHITFSTKNRKNLIDEKNGSRLYSYLGGICKELECSPVQVGGYKNHVHILCLLSGKIAQMDLLQQLKQSSSSWIKTKGEQYSNFYWQNGYGIFSVSPDGVEAVAEYIINQKIHHQRRKFKEEFLLLLKKHNVSYDERYLWGLAPVAFALSGRLTFFQVHSALRYAIVGRPVGTCLESRECFVYFLR